MLFFKVFTHQRKISFRTWRWCGLVCTPATTTRWTPAALNTSLQVWIEHDSCKLHRCFNFFVGGLRNTFFNTVGEIKGGKVSGFHNWIQFYLLEKRGQLNYYSHSFNGPVSIHNTDFNMKIYTLPCGAPLQFPFLSFTCSQWTSYPDALGMQFMWEGYFKQVGSAIIGCSPEFDFALYSLCYITRPGKQWVYLHALKHFLDCDSFLNWIFYCALFTGVVWVWEGWSSLSKPTPGIILPTAMGRSSSALPFLQPPEPKAAIC